MLIEDNRPQILVGIIRQGPIIDRTTLAGDDDNMRAFMLEGDKNAEIDLLLVG
jgi:hypothetical protein